MKKGIVAILVLLLIVLAIYGWLTIRGKRSYDNALPQEPQLVVKLNIDQLIRKGLWYKITHPSFSTRDKSKETIYRQDNGLSIPANIFLFTKQEDPDRIYASLIVKDKENAVQFLKTILNIENFEQIQGVWSGHTADKRSEVMIADDRLLISYSTKKQLQEDGLSGLMNELQTHSPDDELLSSIKENKGDLSVVFENLDINISIEGNSIRLTGQSSKLDFRPVEIPMLGQFLANNWNNDIEAMLSASSNIQFSLKGVVQQIDTITTYEFNDDFEKVAVTKLDTNIVPGMALSLNFDSQSDSKNMIKVLGKNHLALKKKDSTILYFSNSDSIGSSPLDLNTMFRLEVDFESFSSKINRLNKVKFMNEVESLVFVVSENNNGTYIYESSLVMKENVIGLLLDNL